MMTALRKPTSKMAVLMFGAAVTAALLGGCNDRNDPKLATTPPPDPHNAKTFGAAGPDAAAASSASSKPAGASSRQ
jgi:hypothetical protein